MTTYDRIIATLQTQGIDFRVCEHEAEGRTDVVSAIRGNELCQAMKAIVVMATLNKEDREYYLAVVPGDQSLDMDAIKKHIGARSVRFAPVDRAKTLTECEMGAIPPFTFNEDLHLIVDPSITLNEEIVFNAGVLDHSIFVDVDDYIKVANPTFVEIIKKPHVEMAEDKEYHDSQLYRIRHSASHVMAQAVLEMFPEGKTAIGPPIEDRFYYDFDLPRPLTPEDLEKIEARMREIIKEDHSFEYQEVSEQEARQIFADQPFKLELIGEFVEKGRVLSTYQQAGFRDLCEGPHVSRTGELNPDAIKLLNTASAYWRGDEKRDVLQRIYGTAWLNEEDLVDYFERQDERKRRDHRRLGQELQLFSIHQEEIGPGLILWHPKGGFIRYMIEDFCRQELLKRGYEFVYSPNIGKARLWEISGHLKVYRAHMYSPMDVDDQEYFVKPMNCPFHIMIYKARRRSYRELPLRWAELGTVYRYERIGDLHGMLRVRGFTQDDAHIFCRPDQVEDEILGCLDLALFILDSFGFEEYEFVLSVWDPEKKDVGYMGNAAMWEKAEKSLVAAMEQRNLDYRREKGEAAFYGPKIDIWVKDALQRPWQLTTIQFDFNLPGRFDMTYVGEDGREHQPYMVHRAIFGSMERFLGTLIEYYAGAFPVWIMPVQVRVIPIADRHNEYAYEVMRQLRDAGLRVEVDDSSERMRAKIRDAQLEKIPYMLVVGDREVENNTVAVRLRTEENLGAVSLDDFITRVIQVIEARNSI
jgi:threonyl-tRNA synthetase